MARTAELVRAHPSSASWSSHLVLRADSGEALSLDLARWHAPADAEERDLLASARGPVIDLGCGPGRLVVRLASQGVPVLGVDASPSAVSLARRRGATVLERDLFGPLPGEGRWATALLFDGNIGIGGDPVRLLARCRQLTEPGGQVIAEIQPPATASRPLTAWFEHGGRCSPPFPWALVGADGIAAVASAAGFDATDTEPTPSGRWFAHLRAWRP